MNGLTAPDIGLIPRLAELFSVTCDELLGAERRAAVAVDPALVDVNMAVLRIRVVTTERTVYDDRPPEPGETSKIALNLPFIYPIYIYKRE